MINGVKLSGAASAIGPQFNLAKATSIGNVRDQSRLQVTFGLRGIQKSRSKHHMTAKIPNIMCIEMKPF